MGAERIRYYVPLLALFLIAGAYQARYDYGRLQFLLNPSAVVEWPLTTALTSPTIDDVSPEAQAVGVHRGDQLLAVAGRPYTGRNVLLDALYGARPGEVLSVRVRHAPAEGQPAESDVVIRLGRSSGPSGLREWLVVVVLGLLMPTFCLLLGFTVAARRPRDPLAWLLLGLMLSFGQLVHNVNIIEWRGGWRYLMGAYQTFFRSAWPIWMVLFGIYFPERWGTDRRWPWLKWILLVPDGLAVAHDLFLEVGSLASFAAVAPFFAAWRPFITVLNVFGMLSVSVFFTALGEKHGTASSPDARRRLGLLQAGACISLTPSFFIYLHGLIRGIDSFAADPPWLTLPAMLLLFLFPLTFAYVIVVHRALDVRVVIRQGVQYALARGGVRVLQVAVSAAIILLAVSLSSGAEVNRPSRILIIALGVGTIFLIQRYAQGLRAWIDRRFFREAYNAEQILSDLSERVRTMVESGPLLETVAARLRESLHVSRVTMFLQRDGSYRPVYALGYAQTPDVSFPEAGATVGRLCQEKQPVRVYLDRADSWVYETPGMPGERAGLQTLDTQLLLPLAVKERLPGFISLGPKQSEAPYSAADLRLLQSVAVQTGLALENSQLAARVADEMAQRERLNREVEIAREVQERLFPQKLPPVLGLDYCGACRPALGVGGDYYDFLLLAHDVLGIAVGDVSGKGIAAALLMASLQASLRGQAIQNTGAVAQLIAGVNSLVYEASAENRYATLFYAQYEPASRRLTYTNAGHNPPIVLRKTEDSWQVTRLDVGGTVVGLLPSFPYSQAVVVLAPGDVLLAFTDGISEAMNPSEEEWGEERLIEALKACDGLSATDTLTRILNGADAFAAGAKQHDDMTLVVMRVV